MSNFISFRPQDASLPTYIRFSMTNSSFAKLSDAVPNALATLTTFSKSEVIMAYKGLKDGELRVYTDYGVFNCVVADDGFLITGFSKNTLMGQNNAMKYGVCFAVTKGIIIRIRLKDYDYFFDIVNGKQYSSQRRQNLPSENAVYEVQNVSSSVNVMMQKTAENMEESDKPHIKEIEEVYKPEKKLANLLDLADSYSTFSSDIEEHNAMELGMMPYTYIEAADYDRIDRVVYQFGVEGLDENVFKAGVQVEIEDKDSNRHTAEILELIKADSDSPATAMKLIFNEQLSITQFYSAGFFSLSFSTVNKDVQQAATERIRTGKSAAKYMDAVLGRNKPSGFESKNLSEVEAELEKLEHKPNDSQMDAIRSGINTKDVFLVMGPPGTGKTTVIAEWVKYFVMKEHLRVLVSSQNNKAVDNVLARIAEEEGIDMIRIGSESKLQANVVPYMFENRVAELRNKITDESQKNQTVIDSAIALWEEYIKELDRVKALDDIAEESEKVFRNEAKKELLTIHNELKRLLKNFNSVQMNKSRYRLKINKYARKLTRHESTTNPIIRFFTGLFYSHNIKKLNKNHSVFKSIKADEIKIVNRYNESRPVYEKTALKVMETWFVPYYDNKSVFSEEFRNMSGKPHRTDGDIWDLFAISRAHKIKTTRDFAPQKEKISQDIIHSGELKNILINWQEDMGGKQNYALNEIVMESVNLVGATCIGINSQKRFANLNFDVTIIDEAGQIQIHNALVPMSVSNKLIMLGDHKQIPPSADQALVELCEENGVNPDLLEMSLFEKMYRDLPDSNKIMLDTQYRMPAEIADTISEWFYDGKYYSPDFKKGLGSLLPKLSDKPYVIIDTSDERNRHERPIAGAGCDNILEANIIADIIKDYIKNPENLLSEIGVISAYKSQVKLIKSQLATFLNKSDVNEMVATLDSFQGQERNIIFYSFTKSSETRPDMRRIGFLNELRRLNVAMTRCKKMLVLIGDMEFLGGCMHCDKDESGEEIYDKSERQFSDFIRKMIEDVENGRGEKISYSTLKNRLKDGEN